MSANESCSKKERMVCDSGRDRLIDLPSSIIDIILSSISTKDAVRMSILSKQYRYIWISLPHLLFDKSEFRSKKHMEKFVTNVLNIISLREFIIMSADESCSKKERMVCDSGRDWLSEIPSSIMDIILSSISTKEAVRMSILSKQYRYTWISLPHLMFDKSEFRSKKCMQKFVTNVLTLHKGPIHKFVLSLKQSLPIVSKWLHLLHENEIRELILKVDSAVCSIAYLFNKLTRLELHNCVLGQPPLSFRGFLFLRGLILVDVAISLNDVESIVVNSPILEMLKLGNIMGDIDKPELRISAPNLKYLDIETYTCDFMQIYLCAPILAEMRVKFIVWDDDFLVEHRSTYNYTNFFVGCNSIQKLTGNFFNKVMSYGIDACHYSFVLPHLKVIELVNVNFYDVKETSIVARLVIGAPNLQDLKLTCASYLEVDYDTSDSDSDSDSDSEAPDVTHMKIPSAPDSKWEKLKSINMSNLASLPFEIQFLKLLLENSPALERMNLHTCHGLAFQQVKNFRTEILKCNLASPNFRLWFC